MDQVKYNKSFERDGSYLAAPQLNVRGLSIEPYLGGHDYMTRNWSTLPITVFLLLFGCNLLAAILLYGALESTGTFESQKMRLGGAAAGFVIFLLVSSRVFLSIKKNADQAERDETVKETNLRIKELEAENQRLKSAQFPEIRCPEGFELVYSSDLRLGFARPKTWILNPETQVGMYMRPLEPGEMDRLYFQGNINITAIHVTSPEFQVLLEQRGAKGQDGAFEPDDEFLKSPFLPVKTHLQASGLRFEPTFVDNARGIHCVARYPHKDVQGKFNIMEGISVFHEDQARLFIFALHECEELINESREVFQRLVSTVKFT
ncbi:MAG: hypothetical protein ISS65_01910 [Desulfobacterales bacterium]|uniref:Uncharacterized protein n=1 Tax=Candidatus Desulfatibia profunda TaxID=2841695 RepID=A0A8J6NR00_9BACT|nr:hypothetical protein [Candidatus Desulfatibia profunda]MBL7178949.1 hypothetical protein [Desulfobacterales bacterium]